MTLYDDDELTYLLQKIAGAAPDMTGMSVEQAIRELAPTIDRVEKEYRDKKLGDLFLSVMAQLPDITNMPPDDAESITKGIISNMVH